MIPLVRNQAAAVFRRAAPFAAALAVLSVPALAQQPVPPGGGATSYGIDLASDLSVADLIVLSGVIGWIICLLSVVALAVVIENWVTLRRDKLAPPEIVDEVQTLFDENQFQEAMELCENEPNFFTRVVAAGIAKIGHPFEVIQTALQEMGDEEAIKVHQKLGWLSVIAATAPMLGLFGTVQGMIASFHTIASTQNPTPAQLAGGIYTALLTTFEGLMIAIPITTAFAFLRNRLTRNIIEVGAIVEDLFERFRPRENA
jgi:biopolymer transport protein ExbB